MSNARDLLAGGVAGGVAGVITHPIELFKTLVQSNVLVKRGVYELARDVLRTNGIRGFFRGVLPYIIGIVPSRGIWFYTYETSKSYTSNNFMAGLVAGVITQTVTCPIWVVKTRIQLWNCGLREAVNGGLYKGLSMSYIGVLESSLVIALIESMGGNILVTSSLAKLATCAIFYPHDVIRTRMRETTGKIKFNSLYAGFALHLSRVIPNAAITFTVYQTIRRYYTH